MLTCILLASQVACVLLMVQALAAGAQGIPGPGPSALTGRLLLLDVPRHDRADSRQFYLAADGSQTIYSLNLGSQNHSSLAPHMHVRVEYFALEATGDGLILHVSAPVKLLTRGRSLAGLNGLSFSAKPRLLLFMMDFCGKGGGPPLTAEEVNDWMFSGATNLNDYFKTCSNRQVQLDPMSQAVGPIRIPCSGIVPRTGESFTDSCPLGGSNMFRWMDFAADWARAQGVVVEDFHHWVMVLPRGMGERSPSDPSSLPAWAPSCDGWAGLASTAPWNMWNTPRNPYGTGYVWLKGNLVARRNLQILFHEIGHNNYLSHAHAVDSAANNNNGEARDSTCGMAYGGGMVCFNAVHNWQLGWAHEFLELGDGDLTLGSGQTIPVPDQATTKANMIIIRQAALPSQTLYISSRVNRAPYDIAFPRPIDGRMDTAPRVTVHAWGGNAATTGSQPSLALALLLEGEMYVQANTQLVIRFTGWDGAGASVYVCRRRGTTEQNCFDSLDDDCDGLADRVDPDCAGVRRPPPPPRKAPPRPPSPRPRPSPPPPKLSPPPATPQPPPSLPPFGGRGGLPVIVDEGNDGSVPVGGPPPLTRKQKLRTPPSPPGLPLRPQSPPYPSPPLTPTPPSPPATPALPSRPRFAVWRRKLPPPPPPRRFPPNPPTHPSQPLPPVQPSLPSPPMHPAQPLPPPPPLVVPAPSAPSPPPQPRLRRPPNPIRRRRGQPISAFKKV